MCCDDSNPKTGAMPAPVSSSRVIQGPADDSWRDWHKRGSQTPGEAVAADPRKRPPAPRPGQ